MLEGRLLLTGAGSGPGNMALDEALLEGVRLGSTPPTLRIYTWAQPTLSLGRAQRVWPQPGGYDPRPAEAAGLELVRRPTGGRAVLHAGDVTYSLAAACLPEGVKASYACIARGLIDALGRLGVGGVGLGESAIGRDAACFATATAADLRVGARKLLGSAQARRGAAVLQHGSLYLHYPVALAAAAFGAGGEVADMAGLLGRVPGLEEIAAAFAAGLGEALGIAWTPGEPSASEQAALDRGQLDTLR